MQLNDAVSCLYYVISGTEWSIGGMIHTERSEKKVFLSTTVFATKFTWIDLGPTNRLSHGASSP